jgi:predicted PurR-regulated permease PerM
MLIEAIPRFFEAILAKIHPNGEIQLDAAMLERYSIEIAKAVPAYLINILNTGATILYSTVFVIMTPIVTFYLSKDWDKINKSFYSIIRKYTESKTVEIVIQKINRNLILYVNGQLTICTILAIFYTIFLFFVGVKEYIACGILSGFLSFAPFIGPCIGFAITIAVSVDCLQTIMQYILITALYVSVPFVDSYFLTPKLIGHKVGIKPFWILFAVSASTSILGTIGVFLAMPLAVIFSTILKEVYSKPND